MNNYPDRFFRRLIHRLTLCKLGFHYFGYSRKTLYYKSLKSDGYIHDVCHACYQAKIEPTKDKVNSKGSWYLWG